VPNLNSRNDDEEELLVVLLLIVLHNILLVVVGGVDNNSRRGATNASRLEVCGCRSDKLLHPIAVDMTVVVFNSTRVERESVVFSIWALSTTANKKDPALASHPP
jgi:hypothetical protein